MIPTVRISIVDLPRPWPAGLYRKLTKAQREKLKRRLLKKGAALVKTYTDRHGKKRVSMS